MGIKRQGGGCGRGKGVADELPGLVEILVGADAELVDASPVADFPAGVLGLIELLQESGNPVQVAEPDRIPFEELVEKMTVRKLTHLHGVIDYLAFLAEAVVPVVFRDRNDPEVGAGREPAVEGDFPFAEMLAFRRGGKVEETKVDGLLHLVHERRRDEDERGMCLHQPHALRPGRQGGGIRRADASAS